MINDKFCGYCGRKLRNKIFFTYSGFNRETGVKNEKREWMRVYCLLSLVPFNYLHDDIKFGKLNKEDDWSYYHNFLSYR